MINIIKSPAKYSPSGNPVIWQIESTNANIVYFQIEVLDGATVISTHKYYTTPDYSNGTYFNISNILDNLVTGELKNDNVLCQPITKSLASYQLRITERVASNGSVVNGASVTTSTYYVWSAELPEPAFNYFVSDEFVIKSGRTNDFLTAKPDFNYVNFWSTEYLYFINEAASGLARVQIKTFGTSGVKAVYNPSITVAGNKMYRLNVSPKSLQYSIAGMNFTDVTYYTVQLQTSTGTPLSKLRTFKCVNPKCGYEPVNLIWRDAYGSYTSYTFINPIENVTVTTSTIQKYDYKLNASGSYTSVNNGIRNSTEDILLNTSISEYTLTSESLSDVDFAWLMGIIQSTDVYVECTDGVMYPIQIITKNKQVQRRKYTQGLLRFDLVYKAISGLNSSPYELSRFNNRVSQVGINYLLPSFASNGFYTTTIGNGVATLYTVTHNLNSQNLNIQVLEAATGNVKISDITVINNNQITIELGAAVATNSIRVNINKMV